MPFRLVGLTQLGQASFGGASIAQVTLPVAQRLTHKRASLDQISVAAADGVSEDALKRRIERALPITARVETAKENADRGSEEIRENLGFLQTLLLVFGYVAVLVGAFIIFNTFSITVAQRVSEFGVLRTLGASRRQILGSVLLEAMVIGLIGAIVGIAGGFVVAIGLKAAFSALGADLPTTSPVLEARTVIVSALVAFVVTFVAALVPAWRSTRVPPIAALHAFAPAPTPAPTDRPHGHRRGARGDRHRLRRRRPRRRGRGWLRGPARIGGGGVAVVIALSLFSPVLVRPLADLVGRPLELLRRLTGRLARENSKRNPGRTAVTAAALMIALALVTFITVFAAGLKSSVAQVIEENFSGGLVIENSDGFSPIPAGAAVAAAKVPGVKSVATVRTAEAKVIGGGGSSVKVNGPTPNIEEGVQIEWLSGGPRKLRHLRDDEAIVSDDFAKENGLEVGSKFALLAQSEVRPEFTVAGEFESKAKIFGSVLVTRRVMTDVFKQRQDNTDFVDPRTWGRPGEGAGDPHRRRRTRLPHRRSPEPGRTARRTRKADRPGGPALLRAARAGRRSSR